MIEIKEDKNIPNYITNRITLHGAEQEQIEKVFDFFKGVNGEMDFNKIIKMPEELVHISCGSVEWDAWMYYNAKELGNYEELDEMLTYPRCTDEGITTREQLLTHLEEHYIYMEQKSPDEYKIGFENIYEYGKHLLLFRSKIRSPRLV